MRRGEREHHLVRIEIDALESGHVGTRGVLVLLGDRQLDPAAGRERQRLLRLELHQLDPQARVRRGEPVDRGQRERARGGLERRDPDRAADVAGRRGELRLDRLEPGEELPGAGGEHPPRVGQLEPPPRPPEQRHAALPLEL